ncbi:N-acetylmuramoyl-L-alanine amidase family protein [Paenibacillus selenitireducens]|uniref:N-acetylmuramoyl-L-alanine amidase family protein n=1 Tax=Paenibacillus selenitireducens TaxID=1324314 RepID=UPI000996B7C6|nr:N-acetylmuramoyl-L-alanine amidase [Paenibacillus selenitireducens]
MTKVVVIDAGHGGKDPGAIGNNLQEKMIALHIATEAAKRLEQLYDGVKCILTRSTDVFLELKERTDLANKAKADVLVSVHCNAGGGTGGFESFRYTSASAASSAFQDALHTEIMSRLNPFGVNDRGVKAANLHMCRESKMPAVLTENLFIDVLADANRLKRNDVIEAIIAGHVAGVAKYLGLKVRLVNVTNYGEDKDNLTLTNYQMQVLVKTLNDLLKSGVITDKTWVEKAEQGLLSVSELAWLILIILTRANINQ